MCSIQLLLITGHSPDFDCKVETDEALRLKKNIILTNVPMRGDKQYIFAQLHIHIGNETNRTSDSNINDDEGSEHSIDGQFYPMEVKHEPVDHYRIMFVFLNKEHFCQLLSDNRYICNTTILSSNNKSSMQS